MYDDVMRSKASDMNDWKKEDHTMKKGKRIIALFLAVLMIATSDTGVYQAFGMDAANQASEAEKAAGGEGQPSGTVDQEDISGQEQGGAGDTTNQEGGQQEAEVQTPPSNQDNFGADSGTDAATAMILATRQAL